MWQTKYLYINYYIKLTFNKIVNILQCWLEGQEPSIRCNNQLWYCQNRQEASIPDSSVIYNWLFGNRKFTKSQFSITPSVLTVLKLKVFKDGLPLSCREIYSCSCHIVRINSVLVLWCADVFNPSIYAHLALINSITSLIISCLYIL